MKKAIFVLTDKNGNTKDNNGKAYGYYAGNEKELCEAYCKANNMTYTVKKITVH